MPALSKAESRYLNATKGHAWVKAHHFDNSTKGLPEHVKKRKHKRRPGALAALSRRSRG